MQYMQIQCKDKFPRSLVVGFEGVTYSCCSEELLKAKMEVGSE